jgi:CBS domain-containing protein/GNAT superfamily N-acetyltransferase
MSSPGVGHPVGRQVVLRDGTPVALRTIDVDRDGVFCGEDHAAIVAEADGRVAGRAAYSRVYGPRASLTLDVDEAFWHRGVSELLLARLCARAACIGISTFVIRARASDVRLVALLRMQFAAHGTRDGTHVDLELPTATRARQGRPIDRGTRHAATASPAPAPASTFAATRVADVMHGPVVTCGPQTPIQLVAQAMAEEQVHAVVVAGSGRTAWAVVTALDLAAAAATDSVELVARDIAATAALTTTADTPLPVAARQMAEHQVDHLLVLDADGRPSGIMSTIDIARTLAAA